MANTQNRWKIPMFWKQCRATFIVFAGDETIFCCNLDFAT